VASIIAATAGLALAIFFEIPSVKKNALATASHAHAHDGFSYSRDHFEGLVDVALHHAKKLGATNAGAEASEGCGLSVSVRKGELENVERNRDKSLGVTVYVDHRRGNASTSDFSKAAIERTVQAAYDIARFTAEDPTAGLPDEADIETNQRDLDLFHPWSINSHARLSRWLRQLAPQRLGRAHCQVAWPQRRDAARCLVHLDALGR